MSRRFLRTALRHASAPRSRTTLTAVSLGGAALALGGGLVWADAASASSSSVPPLIAPSLASDVIAANHNPEKAPFELVHPQASRELAQLLGDRFSTDRADLEERGKERSGYAAPEWPQCVVWPLSTEEVSAVVRICAAHGIAIIPYAAGTSLEGHTVAPEGGVCMDMNQMDKVLALHVEDMDCVVQPGVGWMDLNEYCAPYGMFLGVDPAPGAAIGGMCGTCCSGTNAVRYGTMKHQVINLTVVLADGTIVKTGQRARKSSAGYDLNSLFVGSEGTLGIVTEATLRLRNIPEYTSIARVSFDDVEAACNAVIKILQRGVMLGAVELMDEEMVRAVNHYAGMELPEVPCVLFKFTGPEPHVAHDVEVVREITSGFTPHPYSWTSSKEESEKLWGARKHAFWAAQAMEPTRELMATDVAVPISRLADCLTATKVELDASPLFAPIVGHVGDGNFHVVIMFDPTNPEEAAEAHRLNRNMVLRGIAMEGTCTGEHGVGLGKKEYLVPEKGENAVALMRTVKRALDPQNILNPGKIIDIRPKRNPAVVDTASNCAHGPGAHAH